MPKKGKANTKSRGSSVRLKGRKQAPRASRQAAAEKLGRFVLPLIIIIALLGCLSLFGLSAYRTATASEFFGVRSIDIRGNERTSTDDIRRIVASSAERSGVWNADLADIRTKVEKFPFVKSAAVSRVLPFGIRVTVVERVPAAVVQLTSGTFLVDGEGAILSSAAGHDKDHPFVLQGWDETKTEKAYNDNQARLKLYKKMLDEWQTYDLSSGVKQVDLANLKEPKAVIEDSGRAISIVLAKENLGKSLKTAMDAIAGKGAKIRSVDAAGVYPVIQYLDF